MGGRYDLTDFEWSVIEPLLPDKPRGVPRVNDRRVLSGIFWVLRSDAPWRNLPERYGPCTTCYNRFNRWRKVGIWDRIMDAVSETYDGDIQMIDSSVARVHQHAANYLAMIKLASIRVWRRIQKTGVGCTDQSLFSGQEPPG